MPYTPKILAFSGSTRTGSFNTKLVTIAAQGAKQAGASVTLISLDDYELPLFSQNLEAARGLPDNAHKLKRLFIEHDGLLISSPEYNGSISPLLKNAIDWVSRKEGDEPALAAYRNKAAVVMAASPGALGGVRALPHVATVLSGIGVTVLPNLFALGAAHAAFADDGSLKEPGKQASALGLGATLAEFLTKHHS